MTLTAAASGTPAPTVQWQQSTDNGVTFTNIAGATSTTYSFTASTTQAGYHYQAVFTNTAGTVKSSAATLSVQAAPVVTNDPASLTALVGDTISLTAAASGFPTPTVQWELSTDNGLTFTNIVGATATTYTFPATAGEDGNEYEAVFTNVAGSATTLSSFLSAGTSLLRTKPPPTLTSGKYTCLARPSSIHVSPSKMPVKRSE